MEPKDNNGLMALSVADLRARLIGKIEEFIRMLGTEIAIEELVEKMNRIRQLQLILAGKEDRELWQMEVAASPLKQYPENRRI